MESNAALIQRILNVKCQTLLITHPLQLRIRRSIYEALNDRRCNRTPVHFDSRVRLCEPAGSIKVDRKQRRLYTASIYYRHNSLPAADTATDTESEHIIIIIIIYRSETWDISITGRQEIHRSAYNAKIVCVCHKSTTHTLKDAYDGHFLRATALCYSAYMLSPVRPSIRPSHDWISRKRLKLG